MTHRDHSPHDDANRLNEALDALTDGDHSGLDELPPEMAETVSRLMWLSHEGAIANKVAPSNTRSSESVVEPHPPIIAHPARRPIAPSPSASPASVPVSRRTQKTAGLSAEPAAGQDDAPSPQPRPMWGTRAVLRVAAIIVVLLLAGGSAYGLFTLLNHPEPSQLASDESGKLQPQQLQPALCSAHIEPQTREEALKTLQDVDVDRDEALRRSIVWESAELNSEEIETFVDLFVRWQSCRRFGSTYQAMALQSGYFTREDFYGESTHDFRGPIETAYSDSTLNEMLDRREELDTTSWRYWESAGTFPGIEETLILGGEVFTATDGQFIAIRALSWRVSTNEWLPTTTVVIYQWSGEEYLLFDIVSTLPGMPPYVYGAP